MCIEKWHLGSITGTSASSVRLVPPCTRLELGLLQDDLERGHMAPCAWLIQGSSWYWLTITGSGRVHGLLKAATYRCRRTHWSVSTQSVLILKRACQWLSLSVPLWFSSKENVQELMRKKLGKSGVESLFRVAVQRYLFYIKKGQGWCGCLTLASDHSYLFLACGSKLRYDLFLVWSLNMVWSDFEGTCHESRFQS